MNQNCKNHIAKLKELGVYEEFKNNVKGLNSKMTLKDWFGRAGCDTFSGAVGGGFTWSFSIQGHEFWSNIANK